MEQMPGYVSILFILTTLLTVVLLVSGIHASFERKGRNKALMISGLLAAGVMVWMGIQAMLAINGFYLKTDTMPPRFPLIVGPVVLLILIVLIAGYKGWIPGISLEWFTYIHIIRIPVEIGLYWLAVYGLVPEVMTFEGRNFDILAGISAPVIGYFCFTKRSWSPKVAIIWNLIALGLLLNVVIHAVLSVPGPIQQMSFEQPNVAVLQFPFIWLPAVMVPVVLFSHLASIVALWRKS
jgi:hypothetical protein